ncbi:MAG: UDP-3-O-(3-hydroxymyristoyl)glucosamine N-acyltransferase [Burkholderiaceae bacterium]|nr:UDP-3-O-(3-hydroxymyristoyl)glucosamine N-acyltransferase [Burkholderiaceae bacterium]
MNGVALGEIAAQLGGDLVGDAALRINRLGSLESATPATLCFIATPRYQAQLSATRAGCVVVPPALREAAVERGAAIVTPDPHLYFARLSQWWVARTGARAAPGIHPSAQVHASARIDASASIGPLCVIEADVVIGARVVVGAHCVIGSGASIGDDTRLDAQVSFGAASHIGARGIIHSGAVIGADGFGFAPHEGTWIKVEQFGGVRIGDDVEIGANTCIDRGALDDTVIGDGVKLDNQVQVGHNVRIGAHTAVAGCAGIAGSTTIGAYCTIAGAVGIGGHLTLGDHVHIRAFSGVMQSITRPGVYTGTFPIDENANWEKNAATLRHLYSLRNRLRALEKKAS